MKKTHFYKNKGTEYKVVVKCDLCRANPVSATKKTVSANKSSAYGLFPLDSRDRNGTQPNFDDNYFETLTLKKKCLSIRL